MTKKQPNDGKYKLGLSLFVITTDKKKKSIEGGKFLSHQFRVQMLQQSKAAVLGGGGGGGEGVGPLTDDKITTTR